MSHEPRSLLLRARLAKLIDKFSALCKNGSVKMKTQMSAVLVAAIIAITPVVADAEESFSPIQTLLSSTTISGYVDTSIEWDNSNDYSVAANVTPQPPIRLFWVRLLSWIRFRGWN